MNKETDNQKYFNQTEAHGKVGKRVQTRVDFSFFPKGSTGMVISADPVATTPGGNIAEVEYDLAIQWGNRTVQSTLADIANRIEQADENENPIERSFNRDNLLEEQDLLRSVQVGKPLVDWFTKDEYERFLDELPGGNETLNTPQP